MPRRSEYISIEDDTEQSRSGYRPIENGGPTVAVDVNSANTNESDAFIAVPDKLGRWYHVKDLDRLFTRVYDYHQRGGFFAMVLGDGLELFQFIFIVWISTFLLQCVNYPILFRDKTLANHTKVRFEDIVYPNCTANMGLVVWICLLVAFVFWLMRLARVVYQFSQHRDMRDFYENVLNITTTDDLDNQTWSDVMQRLCSAQNKVKLCIHKERLDELDIYQRILRHKNYLVAMVNKELLPPRYFLPFVGEMLYFPTIFKANVNWLFFEGALSPWKDYYSLKDDYKNVDRLHRCTAEMDKAILYLGIGNLILSPVIFLYQILKSFFDTAQLVKRQPQALGMRMFSNYGRYYTRHFNELPHELKARLNRAHRPATQYMDQFTSRSSELVARHTAVIFGAVFAVIAVLSVWDEDVLQVEHALTVMTLSGLVVYACAVFIPDENLVWCPQLLLDTVVAHIHYAPLDWKDNAHTERVRYEFSQLFQFRVYYLIEELLSPFVTPFVLLFWLRPRAHLFVRFFYEYTVNETGIGDVCSFAQLDVGGRHANKIWQQFATETDCDQPVNIARQMRLASPQQVIDMARDGKMELSTMHFAVVNPDWQPPTVASRAFIQKLRQRINSDAQEMATSRYQAQNKNNVLAASLMVPLQSPFDAVEQSVMLPMRGRGIRNCEGPMIQSSDHHSMMSSVRESGLLAHTPVLQQSMRQSHAPNNLVTESTALEMSLQCLYLREATRRDRSMRHYDSISLDNSNIGSITSLIRPPTLDASVMQQSTLLSNISSQHRSASPTQPAFPLIEEAEEINEDAPLPLWGANSLERHDGKNDDDDDRPPTSFASA